MTNEEQNIAVAEFCGWTQFQKDNDPTWWTLTPNKFTAYRDVEQYWPQHIIPDYGSDLNAMHEAEKKLGLKECHDYNERLVRIVVNPSLFSKEVLAPCFLFHATASQRREALLRTIGKWKE